MQLMNDVQHYEAARGFAQRIMASGSSPESRIHFAYRSVLARTPSAEETAVVQELYQKQLTKYQSAPAEATKAINFGESKPPPELSIPELASWTLVANLILNMDEAIVRN